MSDTVPDAESRSIASDSSVNMLDCHTDGGLNLKNGGAVTYQTVHSNLGTHKEVRRGTARSPRLAATHATPCSGGGFTERAATAPCPCRWAWHSAHIPGRRGGGTTPARHVPARKPSRLQCGPVASGTCHAMPSAAGNGKRGA